MGRILFEKADKAPDASNSAETADMGHDDGADTYLGTGDAGGGAEVIDGSGGHADVSSGHRDAPSVEIDGIRLQMHRMRCEKKKSPNLPIEAAFRSMVECRRPEGGYHEKWRRGGRCR